MQNRNQCLYEIDELREDIFMHHVQRAWKIEKKIFQVRMQRFFLEYCRKRVSVGELPDPSEINVITGLEIIERNLLRKLKFVPSRQYIYECV